MIQDLLRWYILIELVGFVFLPFSLLWGKTLFSKGIFLSKLWGVFWISITSWIVSSLGIAPFSPTTIRTIFVVFVFINVSIFMKHKNEIATVLLHNTKTWFYSEVLFALPFFLWALVRSFQPNFDSFEKFMDVAIVNGILRTKNFPPQDVWFSGKNINYYYMGHLITAVLITLSKVPRDVGINLMIATIVGFSCLGVFSVSSSLAFQWTKHKIKIITTGLLAILLALFSGSLYTFSYLFRTNVEQFWYWSSIRLIPFTINEMPSYSFAVGDLHAHLSNIPYSMLILSSLITLVKTPANLPLFSYILHGIIIGFSAMISLWDLPISLGLSAVVLVLKNIRRRKKIKKYIIQTSKELVGVFTGMIISTIIFFLRLEHLGRNRLDFVYAHTSLVHFFILWGISFMIFIPGVYYWFTRWSKQVRTEKIPLALLFGTWAIFLLIIPEIVYIKDIYGEEFHRANTVFKFYYQAYMLFGISSAVMLVRIFSTIKKRGAVFLLWSLFIFFGIGASALYPLQILPSYYNQFKQFHGLGGMEFMTANLSSDQKAINWINQHILENPIMLEASGDSYSTSNIVSSFTGLPTVLGWYGHEWFWRNSPDLPAKRYKDVLTMYETTSKQERSWLITQYNISYVYIGTHERKKYPNLQFDLLRELGTIVYENSGVQIIKVEQ